MQIPFDRERILNRTSSAAAGRSFAYRFLGEAFAHPEVEGWNWLGGQDTQSALNQALESTWPDHPHLPGMAHETCTAIRARPLADSRRDHLRSFGYTIRGACPPHEIEYGDTRADALFRPHRLADLVALYSAFGLEMDEETHERADHLAIECEFASILAARTAHALETGHAEGFEACENAWKLFLREHLGRWLPAFVSRLASFSPTPWLNASASFLLEIVRTDCATLGIKPGAADIQLVSYDPDDSDFCTERCGMGAASSANT